MHKSSVAILGAGVSGLTTGIVLNLEGYDTTIYADHLPTTPSYERDCPEFASLYAAASVLPHTVTIDCCTRHLKRSQKFFRQLSEWSNFNVRQQPHYEIFEQSDGSLPEYAGAMDNLSLFYSAPRNLHRDPGTPVSGWSFNAYVVDMPRYMRQLLEFYRNTGGMIVEKHMTRREFLASTQELLVNCGGLPGKSLVDDDAAYEITRGHLVYVDVPTADRPDDRFPFSYNYMPLREVYAQPDGRPADVYFYPRPDRWVFGGSRQVIDTHETDSRSERNYASTITIGGIEVPEPVITLNRKLIERATGIDITEYSMQSACGYRFQRHPVRLEYSWEEGRQMFHNYGHGGAGVTLSWSCAVELAALLEQ
jgi:D-amino-acid oxidase